jgi:hypothetical protein
MAVDKVSTTNPRAGMLLRLRKSIDFGSLQDMWPNFSRLVAVYHPELHLQLAAKRDAYEEQRVAQGLEL